MVSPSGSSGHSLVTQLPPWEKNEREGEVSNRWEPPCAQDKRRKRENSLLTRRLPLFQTAGSGNEFIEKKKKTIRRDFINERDLPCERKRYSLPPSSWFPMLSSLPFSKLLTSPESPHPINCFFGPSEIRKKGIVTLVSRTNYKPCLLRQYSFFITLSQSS